MRKALALLLLSLFPALESHAGVPLYTSNGKIAKWNSNFAIRYKVDEGQLGRFDHASAVQLLESAFAVWQSLPGCQISFVNGGSVGYDVNLGSWNNFQAQRDNDPNFSPIVFDNDGSLTDLYYGSGASNIILGFAGPQHFKDNGDGLEITAGWAILNGKLAQDSATGKQLWKDTLVHELGHFLNLSHSPANLALGQDGDLANNVHIPVMSPVTWPRPEGWAGTTGDDVAIVSSLYPDNNFRENTGTVSGHLTLSDGVTPFKGAHVAAIRLDAQQRPTYEVYSGISGFLDSDNTQPDKKGYFEIAGLPAGRYAVFVESLDARWAWTVNGSDLPAPAEFFNGDESGSDDVTKYSAITVNAGQVTSNLDVSLNTGPVYRYLSVLPLSHDRDGWIATLGINNLSPRAGIVSVEFHGPDGKLVGMTNVNLAGSALSLHQNINRKLTGKTGTLGYLLLHSTQPTTAWISLAAPGTRDPQIMNSVDWDTHLQSTVPGIGSKMILPFAARLEEWKTDVSLLNLGEKTSVQVTYTAQDGSLRAENTYSLERNEMLFLPDVVGALPNTDGYLSIRSSENTAQLVVRGILRNGNEFGSVLTPISLP